MTDRLPSPVTLTAKQARFVECIARGMLSKDAYRVAYDSDVDDKQAGVRAAEVKRSKSVAMALQEVLRSCRLQDLDSVGELIADTKADQEAARQAGAHASVVAANRLRGNWLGIEKTMIQLDPVQMLSDEELIQRLAGDDPERQRAARILIGAPNHFPEAIETEFQEIEDAP